MHLLKKQTLLTLERQYQVINESWTDKLGKSITEYILYFAGQQRLTFFFHKN